MKQKRVLIINGNPNKESLGAALAWSYYEGATTQSEEVELIHLIDLEFDPVLPFGYSKKVELEPDLKMMQEKIKNCDHLVIIHPNWWGSVPALLKGFIDRTFLPGFAFKYVDGSPMPQKLLKGKSARVITTMDTPPFIYRAFFGAPSYNMMKRRVLKFSGFSPVGLTAFGPIRNSKEETRIKWLEQVKKLGSQQK